MYTDTRNNIAFQFHRRIRKYFGDAKHSDRDVALSTDEIINLISGDRTCQGDGRARLESRIFFLSVSFKYVF